ncbi:MAG: hypothetical protein WD226_00335 [Planctomycetota bacterium]
MLRFALERWLQRGLGHRLAIWAGMIVVLSLVGGLTAWAATSEFPHAGSAIWWAFLRLSDPGYLGDDQGAILRTLSTGLTVAGYVLFLGGLVAVMTQWLVGTMRLLESGLTPISMQGHVVILGWTNRTPEIIARLVRSGERLEHFLERYDVRRLAIVVLAEEVDAELRLELSQYLGRDYRARQIFLRSGNALEPEDLARLDITRAAAVIVPAADAALGGPGMSDTRVVKALLTLRRVLAGVARPPRVVAEVLDFERVPIVEATLSRPIEVVSSDDALGRLISQSVRHERLSRVLEMLVARSGAQSVFVRDCPELAGTHPVAWNLGALPNAVALGAVRSAGNRRVAYLNPGPEFRLEATDSVVFLAPDYAACYPAPDARIPDLPPPSNARGSRIARREHKVLVLGFGSKLGALLIEFGECVGERFHVTIVSRASIETRDVWLDAFALPAERILLEHVIGDTTRPKVLRSLELERFDRIVFLPSMSAPTNEAADARTLMGYVVMRSILRELAAPPPVTLELIDPESERLVEGEDVMVLVSPHVSSHLLAQVTLRPELNSLYALLLSAEGSEVDVRTPADFEHPTTYDELVRRALDQGEIVLGLLDSDREREPLRPIDRAAPLELAPTDRLIVLTRDA